MIRNVRLRFNKWQHSTAKAHLLTYKGQEVWIPKKLAWDFQVAGNDLHAWATIPSWLFEIITGQNPEKLMQEIGTIGMMDRYGAIPHTIIEKHVPEKMIPVDSNVIPDLKK